MSTCLCVLCNKTFPRLDPSLNEAWGCASYLKNNKLRCGHASKYELNVYSLSARLNIYPNYSLICDHCIDTLIQNKEIVFLYSL